MNASQLDLNASDGDECEQVFYHFVQSAGSDNIQKGDDFKVKLSKSHNDIDHMTSEERDKAVDAMLENVNQITLNISDPGDRFESSYLINSYGDVKAPYELIGDDDVDMIEIDNEQEFVQNYVAFDESTGKVSSIIEHEDKAQFTGESSFFILCTNLFMKYFRSGIMHSKSCDERVFKSYDFQ